MIRVLVAEDSDTTRQWLVTLLREDPEIEVVGEAKDGLEAVELTKKTPAQYRGDGYCHARNGWF